MSRIKITLTGLAGVLFVVGCASTAVAGPDRGRWTGHDRWEGTVQPDPTTPAQMPSQSPAQTPPIGPPSPPPQNPPAPPSQHPEDQRQAAPGTPPQNQPPENLGDNLENEDDDEDAAEPFGWSTGQRHLGVMVMALTPELRQFFGVQADRGVLIAKVEPSSAAARAGIQVGDVLTRVGPRRITSGSDVIQALAAQTGERIRVAVVRRGQRVRLEATLPSAQRAPVPDPRPL
jgi:membrane-associated protease RseP (regulator of RpoE activity)